MDHFLYLINAAHSAPSKEQSWLYRSSNFPKIQGMPLTTVGWPLDDTDSQLKPTPGLAHTVLAFRPAHVSCSKSTACTLLLFVVWTAAETSKSKKLQNAYSLFLLRLLPVSCYSGQSPQGFDRTLQAREQLCEVIRLSKVTWGVIDRVRQDHKARPHWPLFDFRAAYQERCWLALR